VTPEQTRLVAGRYRLLAPLGSGGMGTVWRAEDIVLGRAVAVKEVTFPHGLSDEDRDVLRERTRREARAAARLDHPSAVTVYDVVEEDDAPYLVMELVEARTLSQVVRSDGPLSPQHAARVGLALLGALEAAHAQGIVHRDVKPGNVLLGDGPGALERVVLTDFGIASSAGDSSITSTGLLLGSPSYIAPERARGQAPKPASDLWSLGATLFTAVEGRPPYDGGDPLTTVTAVVTGDHAPFEKAGPLQPLLEGLLERDPARRMTGAAARRALERVAAGAASDPEATAALPLPPRVPPSAKPAPEQTAALPAEEVRVAVAEAAQAAPAQTARVGRSRLPLVLLGLAAVLAAGVTALALTRPDLGGLTPGGAGSAAPSPSAGQDAAPLPEGWTRFESEREGWSIGVPPGFVQTRRGPQVQFRDPQTRRTLRIRSEQADGGPLGIAEAYSAALAGALADYRELRVQPVPELTRTADLEFTYFSETDLRVVDRTVVTASGETAHHLYWQVNAGDWDDALPQFARIADTFVPAD
jgi:hypothetical protein